MNTSNQFEIQVSATEPDWSREKKAFFCWQPARSLIGSIRRYQKYNYSSNPLIYIYKKINVVCYRFWSVVTGADIPLNCQIGGGLLLPHPNGIVIHPDAVIGPNCLIFQQVTIGTVNGKSPPVIGGHVDIGAGAKILGEVYIANHVCIGANAVVLKNVPTGKTAVGVPAKVLE